MHKIVIAITGASGSIYARLLLDKLIAIGEQWESLAIVMTANAKEVWKTELGNDAYNQYADASLRPTGFYRTLRLRLRAL